jgi:hypothetical protein
MLICACGGTVTGFGLANPQLFGDREEARQMLERQPANRPAPGTAVVTDKGRSGEEAEEYFARPGLGPDRAGRGGQDPAGGAGRRPDGAAVR